MVDRFDITIVGLLIIGCLVFTAVPGVFAIQIARRQRDPPEWVKTIANLFIGMGASLVALVLVVIEWLRLMDNG